MFFRKTVVLKLIMAFQIKNQHLDGISAKYSGFAKGFQMRRGENE